MLLLLFLISSLDFNNSTRALVHMYVFATSVCVHIRVFALKCQSNYKFTSLYEQPKNHNHPFWHFEWQWHRSGRCHLFSIHWLIKKVAIFCRCCCCFSFRSMKKKHFIWLPSLKAFISFVFFCFEHYSHNLRCRISQECGKYSGLKIIAWMQACMLNMGTVAPRINNLDCRIQEISTEI